MTTQITYLPPAPNPPAHGRTRGAVRPFGVFVTQDGLLVRMGSAYTNLAKAQARALALSNQYERAAVMDQRRAMGERMVSLYRRGIDYLSQD